MKELLISSNFKLNFTAIDAAVPAASPIPTQIGMALKLECAIWVPEIFLPQSKRFSFLIGNKQP